MAQVRRKRHLFIPDTQVKAGVPTNHLTAAGNYAADKKPDVIVMIGDWWDMPSLSSYDKPGSEGWESKDVKEDFEAGIEAMQDFLRPIRKARNYNPKLVFTMGNHENRVKRAREDADNRRFKQYLSDDNFKLKEMGWKVYPFLKPAYIDGISYCHYFTSGPMDRPIGGMAETRIKTIGHSFVAGHQQTYQVGAIYTSNGERRRGLVCGTFYQHDEDYMSVQANSKAWRGCFMLNEVHKGDYDLLELSVNYLLENWQ
tara:strand:- start:1985 stop:2752 length:768 start_codon:yes stop_codon:yes gene_type:complete